MYGRSFEDPDGNHWEPNWMNARPWNSCASPPEPDEADAQLFKRRKTRPSRLADSALRDRRTMPIEPDANIEIMPSAGFGFCGGAGARPAHPLALVRGTVQAYRCGCSTPCPAPGDICASSHSISPGYKDPNVQLFESGAILIHLGITKTRAAPTVDVSRGMRAISWLIAALTARAGAGKPHAESTYSTTEEWARLRALDSELVQLSSNEWPTGWRQGTGSRRVHHRLI